MRTNSETLVSLGCVEAQSRLGQDFFTAADRFRRTEQPEDVADPCQIVPAGAPQDRRDVLAGLSFVTISSTI